MNHFPKAPPLGSPSPVPWVRILSDGHYRLLLNAQGTGHSGFDGLALTPDPRGLPAPWSGSGISVSNVGAGEADADVGGRLADAGVDLECGGPPGVYRRVEDFPEFTVAREVAVIPGAGAEIHRVTLRNLADRSRRLEVTTRIEVALNDPAAHAGHPVFSKLFLETEWAEREQCLLVRRRPRAPGEPPAWMFHALLAGRLSGFETDRRRFWGRGSGLDRVRSGREADPRSGTLGAVLDPLLSLRAAVDLAGSEESRVVFVIGAAPDRSTALASVQRLVSGEDGGEASFLAAQVHADAELLRLGLSAEDGEYLQALAGAVLHGHPGLRSEVESVAAPETVLEALTRFGLRAQTPWIVIHPSGGGDSLAALALTACRYWKSLGLPLMPVVVSAEGLSARPPEDDGYVLLCPADVPPAGLGYVDAAARAVIRKGFPDLIPRAPALGDAGRDVRPMITHGAKPPEYLEVAGFRERGLASPAEPLHFMNGFGGFSEDGREYVIRISHANGRTGVPPRPWTNVVANEQCGFLVSETGAGTTWTGNSREHRITPWYNDPLLDPHGEGCFVRDEETAEFWSTFPGPRPLATDYEVRHGLGYTVCRMAARGLDLETTVFVPRRDPLKISILRITEREGRRRRLSLYAYYRLVIGELPETTRPYVITRFDAATGIVSARNIRSEAGGLTQVFAAVATSDPVSAFHITGDRLAFLGPGQDPANPAAVQGRAALDGRTGSGLDPCMAQQVVLEIPPGSTTQVAFLLGGGEALSDMRSLTATYRESGAVDRALQEVRDFWKQGVSGVRITTPMADLDLLVNAWLPYQVLSCRLWGRTALYQSGGAFGYRDQLQDAAALIYLWPRRTREQILLHAEHQFEEGDVLHWWHPPHSRGLRTRFADDLLWLPFVCAYYLQVTGDRSVLHETAPFLRARLLEPGEDEAYLLPEPSSETADVYEHCCRALDRSLTRGDRGLPLFGTGDWNDGMNRVGREGRGESVWLGFFLYSVLEGFLPICRERKDEARARRYQSSREGLLAALNDAGWDGAWYRRGYYDDGSPLGSSQDDECRIDGLVQAWAVLSGAAPPERAARAMDAVEAHLVSERDGIIRLLTPPFDVTSKDPGYIRGYVPGVRENGGQYTHAALWMAEATARLGRNNRAARLLGLLSPIRHTRTREAAEVYGAEPYVVAADVYGEPPHVGHAGWSWYTGSAGWMYRVALESILGFQVRDGSKIVLDPCVPDEWPEFTVEYRIPGEETAYRIHATNPQGMARGIVAAALDGVPLRMDAGIAEVTLAHDGLRHQVDLVLGDPGTTRL